jgi:hypothetical protein
MPFSSVEINLLFAGTYHLYFQCERVSETRNQEEVDFLLNLIFKPKYEDICSFETSVDFYQIIRLHNPEDRSSLNQRLCVGTQ